MAESPTQPDPAVPPVKVIFETDMTFDVDDVGALAMLHALADRGEVELLAVNYNEVHPGGVAAIDAINSWYGRRVPIGAYKGELPDPDASRYLHHLADYPHSATASTAPSALRIYRDVLAGQPDRSVTIISVGFLNNLAELLRAEPALVERTVKALVVMGGLHDDGFNFVRHGLVGRSAFVIENWPTPLVVSDFGARVHTGASLAEAPAGNPVRGAYLRWFGGVYRGRSSWDQVAVLYGVRGATSGFDVVTDGTGSLPNGYRWNLQASWRTHLKATSPVAHYASRIEALMLAPPERSAGH